MNNVKEVAATFFRGVWDLLLHTDFPGLDVSFAAVFVSFFLISFSIRIFAYLTGFGLSGSDYGRSATSIEKLRSAEAKRSRGKSDH